MLARFALAGALLMGLLMTGPGTAQEESAAAKGRRIIAEAGAGADGYRDITLEGEMTLRTASGQASTRQLELRAVRTGGEASRALLVFRAPEDIRGTALLTHSPGGGQSDRQWLYLPALGAVREISGAGRGNAFAGSEFAFEDLADQDLDRFTYRYVVQSNCPGGGGVCHVVDRFPTVRSAYSLQRVWIETRRNVVRQVDYYDRGQTHLKSMRFAGFRQMQGQAWRATRTTMRNLLTGRATTLRWTDYSLDQGIDPTTLTVDALRTAR